MAPKVTKFTDENLVLLRNAVNEALGSVGKKFNVTFRLAPIRSTREGAALAECLSVTVNAADGVPEEVANWNDRNLQALGLKKEWLGQTFKDSGLPRRGERWQDEYTITGLDPNDKYPVQAIRVRDGKEYRFAVKAIRKFFEPDVVLKETEAASDQAREDWKKYAESRSFKPEWLDQTFAYLGEKYKITGLLPQSRKFSVKCIRLRDNSGRICTAEMVREGMAQILASQAKKPAA